MTQSKIKSVIWVVLMDKKKQKITAGRECDEVSAGELRDAVCRKLGITQATAFAIWICSPLLQLQLKASHYPTALCELWYDLLAQFAPVSEQQALSDTPIIMLMRDVFYPFSQERALVQRDHQARYYLTAEAMFNFVTGRYPVEEEVAYKLAALQLKMEGKRVDNFPPGTIQHIASEILPWDIVKRRRRSPLLIDKRIREHLDQLNLLTPGTLDHVYLSHVWTQTCYRCAFFQGQAELARHRKDVPVRVGITPHHIIIWNTITNKSIAEIEHGDVTTKLYKAPEQSAERNTGTKVPFDVWLITFNIVATIKNRVGTAIPIFSKQACMMQTMFDRMHDEAQLHSDTSTGLQPGGVEFDSVFTRHQDVDKPMLRIGAREVPVSTKHVSKKEHLLGVLVTTRGKLKKPVVRQKTNLSKFAV